ncbi:MAG: hypothetical protein ACLGPL_05190 [Acidobacteriota bacterium]
MTIVLWSVLFSPLRSLALEPRVIYDGRLTLKPTKPAGSDSVLMQERVFPAARKEWHEQERDQECLAGTLPAVIDVAQGAFTKPGSKQKAVLYQYCESGHNLGLSGIAVIEDNRVVSHLVFEGASDTAIGALPDINENGRSEILLAAGGTNQGFTWGAIRIIELSDTIVLTKFGRTETFLDDCGVAEKNGKATAYRLSVATGTTPVCYRESFINKGACEGTGTWKKLLPQKRISLENDESEYQFIR